MTMTDDALVTFFGTPDPEDGHVSFRDAGYMPVNEVTVGGTPLNHPPGHGNLFIHYMGEGDQYLDGNGLPTTAVYRTLQYELVSYNGAGKFGHAADGTPTASGVGNPTLLAQGHLIGSDNQLTVDLITGISGTLHASLLGPTPGTLDITVSHSAGDIHPIMAGSIVTGLTLDGGMFGAHFTPT